MRTGTAMRRVSRTAMTSTRPLIPEASRFVMMRSTTIATEPPTTSIRMGTGSSARTIAVRTTRACGRLPVRREGSASRGWAWTRWGRGASPPRKAGSKPSLTTTPWCPPRQATSWDRHPVSRQTPPREASPIPSSRLRARCASTSSTRRTRVGAAHSVTRRAGWNDPFARVPEISDNHAPGQLGGTCP